jgi:spoIIIJ-associated protein
VTGDRDLEDALDIYVESLEKEQKDNQLIENDNKIKKREENREEEITGLEKIRKILKKSIELICVGEKVKINADSKELKLSVYGDDLGIAIGRNGKNMQALEYIINLISKRKNLVSRNIIIDIKDYRQKRIEKIKKNALSMAKKAINEGRKIALQPMCSYERKIIHNALAKLKEVNTRSIYEEPNRKIIIYPVKDSK